MSTKTPVELWCDALRSGEYKQGRTVLHDTREDSWCCLGVACDLYRKHVGPLETIDSELCEVFVDGSELLSSSLVTPVMSWLGIDSRIAKYDGRSLASDNDNGVPFPEIADIIESRPPGLFVEASPTPPGSE